MPGGRPRSTIGAVAGCIAMLLLFAASAVLSSRISEEDRSTARTGAKETAARETLLAEISRRPAFAFGFRNFLADMVWLKAIQVSGARRMGREDYDELYRLLDTVINFDPGFKIPYHLGGLILAYSPDHTREALATLNRGWKNHPLEWQFPFYMGFIQYFSLGNPVEGGKLLLEAARIPKSAPYLPLLASRVLSEGREPETALAFLTAMMDQEKDPGRRQALEKRIREVIVERDIQTMERAAEEYRRRTGMPPGGLSDLVKAGLVPALPREPNGGVYLMEPGGAIRSTLVDSRMKVFRKR